MFSRDQNCCWCGQSGPAHPRGDRTRGPSGAGTSRTISSSWNSKLFKKASWFATVLAYVLGSCFWPGHVCFDMYWNQSKISGQGPRPNWKILFGFSHPCLITNVVSQPVLAGKWYIAQLACAVVQYGLLGIWFLPVWSVIHLFGCMNQICAVGVVIFLWNTNWCFKWPGCLVHIRIPSHWGPSTHQKRVTGCWSVAGEASIWITKRKWCEHFCGNDSIVYGDLCWW